MDFSTTHNIVESVTLLQKLNIKAKGWRQRLETMKNTEKLLVRHRFLFPVDWIRTDRVQQEFNQFDQILQRKLARMHAEVGVKIGRSCSDLCVHSYLQTCMHIYICMCASKPICRQTYRDACVYVHTDIHTNIQTYTHTHTYRSTDLQFTHSYTHAYAHSFIPYYVCIVQFTYIRAFCCMVDPHHPVVDRRRR